MCEYIYLFNRVYTKELILYYYYIIFIIITGLLLLLLCRWDRQSICDSLDYLDLDEICRASAILWKENIWHFNRNVWDFNWNVRGFVQNLSRYRHVWDFWPKYSTWPKGSRFRPKYLKFWPKCTRFGTKCLRCLSKSS